jgi:hypothetical protein
MRLKEHLARVATTLLGIVLAFTPAALWISWSATMVMAVMATALACAGLLVLLTESSPPRQAREPGALPEAFIDEVHRLFPLTYHHSSAGPRRFRLAMKELRELLKSR